MKAHITPRASFFISMGGLLLLTIALFGHVLFTSKQTVLSNQHTDLFMQFVFWRDFGFSQMRQANLALWNPHIFSGTPFLGGFQSALLYPLNLLYLVLPLVRAINVTIVLHVLLAGIFMYLWTWHRRLHPAACFLAAVLMMFSGTHFLHIYAGHLANLCTMIWAPVVFLSFDALFEKRSFLWCLLGAFAVTMQILAGHPQYVFFTALAAGIYGTFCVVKSAQRVRLAAGYLAIYLAAAAMGAVQLFTGLQASGETIRSIGLPYEMAAMFSFPPENLITLLAPDFFGKETPFDYWGRCYLWEMSLFFSVTGLVLAIYAASCASRQLKRFSVWMVLILLLLALGDHTPLFKILYHWIPPFDKFRSISKFTFPASLFLIMLAAIGLDHLIRKGEAPWKVVSAVLSSAVLLAVLAFFIRHTALTKDSANWWQQVMYWVYETKESYLPPQNYSNIGFIRKAGMTASSSLLLAAGTLVVLSFLLWLSKFWNKASHAIVFLAVIEVFTFAKSSLDTFEMESTQNTTVSQLLVNHPGDYRILNLAFPNGAMSSGAQDLWGYDPGVLRRYAQFMAFTQGQDPDQATQYLFFRKYHKLYTMLRCRFFGSFKDNRLYISEANDVMPRLHFIKDYRVITDRDQIFAAMSDPGFNPRKTVILETSPTPQPIPSNKKGEVSILNLSTDHMMIEASVPDPTILLITDNYSKGWQVRPMDGSSQKKYDILPANYVLRAIPLRSGYHQICVEYLPSAFEIGKWTSISSSLIYLGLLVYHLYKKGRRNACIQIRT